MPGNVTYWRENDHVQNLGDYLAESFPQRFAAVPPTLCPRIHLVGSCISNYFIRADLAACKANCDGDGQIDLPFKWADFAASMAIPVYFVANVADGMAFWVENIAPVLRVPDLTPLLAAFPGDVRPEILALVARGDAILRAQAEPAASQLGATTC